MTFKKSDLQTGMVVVTAQGERFLVLRGQIRVWDTGQTELCFVGSDGYINEQNYTSDLRVYDRAYGHIFDIVGVYKPRIASLKSVLAGCSKSNLVWKRPKGKDLSEVPKATIVKFEKGEVKHEAYNNKTHRIIT